MLLLWDLRVTVKGKCLEDNSEMSIADSLALFREEWKRRRKKQRKKRKPVSGLYDFIGFLLPHINDISFVLEFWKRLYFSLDERYIVNPLPRSGELIFIWEKNVESLIVNKQSVTNSIKFPETARNADVKLMVCTLIFSIYLGYRNRLTAHFVKDY